MKKVLFLVFTLGIFSVTAFSQEAVDYNYLINNCYSSVKSGKFTDAVEFCSSALAEKRDSGMAYYLRAFSYSKIPMGTDTKSPTGETVNLSGEQRKQFTVADAEKCIQFIPDQYPCYSLIGSFLYTSKQKDDLEKAAKNLTEAIRLGDKDKMLYYYRAIANFNIAKILTSKNAQAIKLAEQSVADFTASIQLNPDQDYNFQRRAEAYEFLGKFDLAIADLTKFLETNDENDELFFKRGKFYLNAKKYDLAIEDFTKALEILDEPYNTDFEENLKEILPFRMQAYKALKQKNEFCKDLKRIDENANCDKEWKKK